MKPNQTTLFSLPYTNPWQHVYCTGCGARGNIKRTRLRPSGRKESFPRKEHPSGWSRIRGSWLCEPCIASRFEGYSK